MYNMGARTIISEGSKNLQIYFINTAYEAIVFKFRLPPSCLIFFFKKYGANTENPQTSVESRVAHFINNVETNSSFENLYYGIALHYVEMV